MNEQLYQPSERTLHWNDRSSASNPTIRQSKDQAQEKHEICKNTNQSRFFFKQRASKLEKNKEKEDIEESLEKGNLGGKAGLDYSFLLFMGGRTETQGLVL